MCGGQTQMAFFEDPSTAFNLGIDSEGIDFSQLELIDSGSTNQNFTFGDSPTAVPSGGQLLNVIVENKRNNNGHSLPETPPDSSWEYSYSPQDGWEAPLNTPDNIDITLTSNLGPNIYKQDIFNPTLADSFILGSHIVVADQTSEGLVDGGILQDNRLLVTQDVRNGNNVLGNQLLQESLQADHGITLAENVPENNHQILFPNVQSEANPNFSLTLCDQKDFGDENQMVHLRFTPGIETMSRGNLENGMNLENNLENIPSVCTNLPSGTKKRKLRQETMAKSEQEPCSPSQLSTSDQLSISIDEEGASSEACLSEFQYQCIKFNPFQQSTWHTLCDQKLLEVSTAYQVAADKGFNFSNTGDAFVCQKKNHFQVTCQVKFSGDAKFVYTPDGWQKISNFYLHFYGVKHDCPTQTIRVEQSQPDRSKKPFHPVLIELMNYQARVKVGRLHFSETTLNNMRKNGKLNPEQRYFQLVVGLHAHTMNGNFPIVSHASQKIIVRASNPGTFESDVELCWEKGQTQNSVFHNGKVGINIAKPDESLVVHGNIKITGHIIQPSDIRVKKNIVELNTAEQLKNVQKLRVVRFEYEPAVAAQLGRGNEYADTGVIAQEVAQVLPEAVRSAGDLILENGTCIDNLLVLDKERMCLENLGAVKELGKVTHDLNIRVEILEQNNQRDSPKSDSIVSSSEISYYSSQCNCSRGQRCKYCERQEEKLCSTKFIQVIIVVLVLIVAFCLAAITTLYLLETAKHNQILKADVEMVHSKVLSTKKPTLDPKMYNTWSTVVPHKTTNSASYIIIGRPNECLAVEQDLARSNLCQIYCCAPHNTPPVDLAHAIYSEKRPPNLNKTESGLPLTIKEQEDAQAPSEKNKISKPFHSNDTDKQIRTRRDTYDISNEANAFDLTDDQQMFSITIQGRNFSTPLAQNYLTSNYNSYNFSYSVPISKYMRDDYINIIFRFMQLLNRDIQYCYNDFKHHECPYITSTVYDDKTKRPHKVNETTPSQYIREHSLTFDVDMTDFQSKIMTYRAGLSNNNENFCRISESKLGVEFVEYNFHFVRQCDE